MSTYRETSPLESNFEVVGLAGDDSLVEVEGIRPTDQLTIRVFFRKVQSGTTVSFLDVRQM